MTFTYPYDSELKKQLSKLRDGRDYYLFYPGTSIQENITRIDLPIIEIGGPTEAGFFFLDSVQLNTQPVITNISLNPLPFSPNAIELARAVAEQLDGTDMPYEDESVGVFLMSAMSLSSDWWVDLDDVAKEKAEARFEKEFEVAKLEMGQVAIGVLEPSQVIHAQRVKIYREIHRTLAKDGLFFSDGGVEEIVIMQKLGFEIIALLQQANNGDGSFYASYEFVAQKRF